MNQKKIWRRALENLLERFTPFQIAFGIFFLLLAGTIGLRMWGATAARADYNVFYEPAPRTKIAAATKKVENGRIDLNDPSVIYAERVREANAAAIGLTLAVVDEGLGKKRVITEFSQMFDAAEARGLLPPGIKIDRATKTLRSAHGVYYLRYRARPFGLEIISVGGRGYDDGELFMLRLPDDSGVAGDTRGVALPTQSFAALWTAPSDSTLLPEPFAAAANYSHNGWKLETLRASEINLEKLAEFNESLQKIEAR